MDNYIRWRPPNVLKVFLISSKLQETDKVDLVSESTREGIDGTHTLNLCPVLWSVECHIKITGRTHERTDYFEKGLLYC